MFRTSRPSSLSVGSKKSVFRLSFAPRTGFKFPQARDTVRSKSFVQPKPKKQKPAKYFVDFDYTATRLSQISCMVRSLKETMNRLKICTLLPQILMHAEELETILKDTEYENAVNIIHSFKKRQKKRLAIGVLNMVDKQFINIIDYFEKNPKIFDILPDWKNNLRKDAHQLLAMFSILCDVAEKHMNVTPETVFRNERELHLPYLQLESISQSNEAIEKKIRSRRIRALWKVGIRYMNLRKLEDKLYNKQRETNYAAQEEINNINMELHNNHRTHLELMRNLEENYNTVTDQVKRAMHLATNAELEARAEKNKYMLQLETIIRKYDQVIGEKKRELFYLEDEYQQSKKMVDDFMIIYNREERIYLDVAVKYEEEQREKQLRRVNLFRMNRAARIIQKYFRTWLKARRKKLAKHAKEKKKKY